MRSYLPSAFGCRMPVSMNSMLANEEDLKRMSADAKCSNIF